jgi:DNA-binding transcriptional regulator YiaG
MTKAEFHAVRKRLGLTQTQLAEMLKLGKGGRRTIGRWESGEVPISGPAAVAVTLMLKEAAYANPK